MQCLQTLLVPQRGVGWYPTTVLVQGTRRLGPWPQARGSTDVSDLRTLRGPSRTPANVVLRQHGECEAVAAQPPVAVPPRQGSRGRTRPAVRSRLHRTQGWGWSTCSGAQSRQQRPSPTQDTRCRPHLPLQVGLERFGLVQQSDAALPSAREDSRQGRGAAAPSPPGCQLPDVGGRQRL